MHPNLKMSNGKIENGKRSLEIIESYELLFEFSDGGIFETEYN